MKKALRMGSRRILAFILSLSMVLSYVPSASAITAFADEMTEEVYEDTVVEENEEVTKAVVEEVDEGNALVETPDAQIDIDDDTAEEDTDSGLDGARGVIVEEAHGFYSYYDDADRGVRVIVKAEEGVVPEGAHLDVEPVELDGEDMISESGDEDVLVSQKFSYDIKIYLDEEETEEFQPENVGDVTVKFVMLDVLDDELYGAKIYHKADGADEAEELDTAVEVVDGVQVINEAAQSADAEKINDEKLEIKKGEDVTTAEVAAPGFSLYVFELYQVAWTDFELTTNDRTFQVTKEGIKINSTDILEALGLVGTGSDITEIKYAKGYTVSLEGKYALTDGISISANDPLTAEDDTYVVFGEKAFEDLIANGGRVCLIYNLYDQDTNFHKLYVAITLVEVATDSAYPIWVDGIIVTEKNKDDVLGDGTGSVQFIPSNGTIPAKLLVNNAEITKYSKFDTIDINKYIDEYNKYRAARAIATNSDDEGFNLTFGYGGIFSLLDDDLDIEFTGKNIICFENDEKFDNTASASQAAAPTTYGIFAKEDVVVNVGTEEKAGYLRVGADVRAATNKLNDTVSPEFGIVSRNGKVEINSTDKSHMTLTANYVGVKALEDVTFNNDSLVEIQVIRPDYVGNADKYNASPVPGHPAEDFRYYASGVVSRTGNVTFANTRDLVIYSQDQNNVVSAAEKVIFKNTADVTIMSQPLTEEAKAALYTAPSVGSAIIPTEYNDYGEFKPYVASEDAENSNGIKAKEIEVYIDKLATDSSINIVGAESAADVEKISYIGETDETGETLANYPYVTHSFMGFNYNFSAPKFSYKYLNDGTFNHDWVTTDPDYGFSHATASNSDSYTAKNRYSSLAKSTASDFYEYVFPTLKEIETAENYKETAGVMIQRTNDDDRTYYNLTILEESFVECNCGEVLKIDEYDAKFIDGYDDPRYSQTSTDQIEDLEKHVVKIANGAYVYGDDENGAKVKATDAGVERHNIFDIMQFDAAIATGCDYGKDIYKIDSTIVEYETGWDKGDTDKVAKPYRYVDTHDVPEVVNPDEFLNDGSENKYTVYVPNMQKDVTVSMRTYYNVWVGDTSVTPQVPVQVSSENWGVGTDSDWTYCPIHNRLILNDYNYNGTLETHYYDKQVGDANYRPATESDAAILYEGERDFNILVNTATSSVVGNDNNDDYDHASHVISAPDANINISGDATLEVWQNHADNTAKNTSTSVIYGKDVTVSGILLDAEAEGVAKDTAGANYYSTAIFAQGDFEAKDGAYVHAATGAVKAANAATNIAAIIKGNASIASDSEVVAAAYGVDGTILDERELELMKTLTKANMDGLPVVAGLFVGGSLDVDGKLSGFAANEPAKTLGVGVFANGAVDISGEVETQIFGGTQASVFGFIADAEDTEEAPAMTVSGKLNVSNVAPTVVLNNGILALNGTIDAEDGAEIAVNTAASQNAAIAIAAVNVNSTNADILANASDSGEITSGILAMNDITISDGKVTATAGKAKVYSIAINSGVAALKGHEGADLLNKYLSRFIYPVAINNTGKITISGGADVYAYSSQAKNTIAIQSGVISFASGAMNDVDDPAAYKIKITDDSYVVALADAGAGSENQTGVMAMGDIVVKGDEDITLTANKPNTSALVVALTGQADESEGIYTFGYILNDGGYISVSGRKDQPGSFDGVKVTKDAETVNQSIGIYANEDILNVNNAYTGVRLGTIYSGNNNDSFDRSYGIYNQGSFYNGFIAGNPSIRAQEELEENAEGGRVFVYGIENQQHDYSGYKSYGISVEGDFKQYDGMTSVKTYNTALDVHDTVSAGITVTGLMYVYGGTVTSNIGLAEESVGISANEGITALNDAAISSIVDGTNNVNDLVKYSVAIISGNMAGKLSDINTSGNARIYGKASGANTTSVAIYAYNIKALEDSNIEGIAQQAKGVSVGLYAQGQVYVDHAEVKGQAKAALGGADMWAISNEKGLSAGVYADTVTAKNGAILYGDILNANGGRDPYMDEAFGDAYAIAAKNTMTVEGEDTIVLADASAAHVVSGKAIIAGIYVGKGGDILDNYSKNRTYGIFNLNDGKVVTTGGYYSNSYVPTENSTFSSHGIIAGDININNGLFIAMAGHRQSQNDIYGISAVGMTGGTYPQLYISDLAEVVSYSATETPFFNNNHLGGNIYKTGYAPVITLADDIEGTKVIVNFGTHDVSLTEPDSAYIAAPDTVGTSEIYATGLDNQYIAIRRGAYVKFDKAMDEVATDSEEKVFEGGVATGSDDIKAVAYTEKDENGNYVLRIHALDDAADETIKNEHFTLLGWDDGTELLPEGEDSLIPETRATVAKDETARKIALISTFGPLEYTITYDVLDGEFLEDVEDTQTYCYNNGIDTELSSNLVELYDDEDDVAKTGYHLLGWDIDHKNIATPANAFFADFSNPVHEDLDATAVWEANTYTVKYVTLEGVVLATESQTYDQEFDLPVIAERFAGVEAANLPQYKSYCAWVDEDTDAPYQQGETVVNLTDVEDGVVTLVASTEFNVFIVKYDRNGGDEFDENNVRRVIPNQFFRYGTDKALHDEMRFAKKGYTFVGWATEPDGEPVFKKFVKNEAGRYLVSKTGAYRYNWNVIGDKGERASQLSFGTPSSAESYPEVTLYAIWTPNQYSIEFYDFEDPNRKVINNTYEVYYDEEIDLPEHKNLDYVKPGYHLTAWRDSRSTQSIYEDGKINLTDELYGKVKLLADWAPNSFTIKYIGGYQIDGYTPIRTTGINPKFYFTVPAVYEKVDYANLPFSNGSNVFEYPGYHQTGWEQTGADKAAFIPAYGENIVQELTAVWVPNTYTVKFDGNGADGLAAMFDQSFTYDAEQALTLNDYTRTGYTFGGWANGTKVYTDGETVKNLTQTEDGVVTLTAIWEPIKYTVTYQAGTGLGAEQSEQIAWNATVNLKTTAALKYAKKGYRFDHWDCEQLGRTFSEGEEVTGLLNEESTVVLVAAWAPLKYTIKFTDADSIYSQDQEVTYDDASVLLPISSAKFDIFRKTGYTFKSWKIAGDFTGNVDWHFEDNVSLTNDVHSKLFDGISYNENTHKWEVILQAEWTENEYTVVFDSNKPANTESVVENYMAPQTFKYSEGKKLDANQFALKGYKFVKWVDAETGKDYLDNQYVNKLATADGATVTLKAVWEPITYTIVLDNNLSGTAHETKTLTTKAVYDKTYYLPNKPFERYGYNHTGYLVENYAAQAFGLESFNKNLTTKDNDVVTLYATWVAGEFTITFDNSGMSTVPASITKKFETNIVSDLNDATETIKNGSHDGYEFAGWYYTTTKGVDVPFVFTTMPGVNVTVFAKWTPINYTIQFNGNSADNMTAMDGLSFTATYDKEKSLPANLYTRVGYKFDGWATKATPAPSDPIYKDKVTIDADVNFTTVKNSAVTLFAQWKEDKYTITYTTTKGNTPAALTEKWGYSITDGMNDATEALGSVVGYEFGGWYYTDLTGKDVKFVSVVMPKMDITLKAKWIPITYTIKFDANTGVNDTAMDGLAFTATYDAVKNLPANLYENKGYVFKGWATVTAPAAGDTIYVDKASIDADVNFTTVKGSTVTLFAQWTEDDYVIEFIKEEGTSEDPHYQNVTFKQTQNLDAVTFAKTGYTFLGWKPVVDPTTDVMLDGSAIDHEQLIARVSTLDNHVKLVGQWKANTYEFRFNANKPAATTETPTPQSMSKQTFTYGVEESLKANEFVIKGYTFDRWTLDKEGLQELTGFSKTQPTKILNYTSEDGAVINLFAQWTANEYQIQLYRNVRQNDDDEFFTINTNAKFDQSYVLPNNPFVRTGYLPDGWKDHKTGLSYANNALVKNLSYSIAEVARLDAQWKAINYTIKFHNNDSVGDTKVVGSVDTYAAKYDQVIDWPHADFTRTGYDFLGWAENPGTKVAKYAYTGNAYSGITEIMNLADTEGTVVNLYAVWVPHKYTIDFHENGGTPTINSINAVYDATYNTPFAQDLVNLHKDGYSFLGWSRVNGVAAPDFATNSVLKNLTPDNGATVDLYAVWKPNGYIVRYLGNGATGGSTNDTLATRVSDTVTISYNGYYRNGYSFNGWNTRPDGLGTKYTPGTNVSHLSLGNYDQNVVVYLYAQWKKTSTTPSYSPSSTTGSTGGGGGGGAISFTKTNLEGTWEFLGNNQWVFNNADGSGRFTGWGYKSYTTEAGVTLTYKYHFGSDGIMTYGWFYDEADNAWYYLSETNDGFFGHMVTGWHLDPQDGRWYYLDPTTGKMVTGEKVIDGKTYFFNEVAPAQSWYRDAEGNWVYFDYQVRTYGSMYCNEVTPAGWTAGADGAKIG